MTDPSMFDRIAKAIEAAQWDENIRKLSGPEYYRAIASAVVAVMPEPTAVMVHAGDDAWHEIWGGGRGVRREVVTAVWNAMVAEIEK